MNRDVSRRLSPCLKWTELPDCDAACVSAFSTD